MNRTDILHALDSEIDRLQQARTLLADAPDVLPEAVAARRGPGRPKGAVQAPVKAPAAKKRTMSPEGRARIAAAQKARWAKLHKPAKKAAASSKTATKQVAKSAKKATKKATGRKAVAKKVTAPTATEPVTS